jgi:acetyl-CoA carboxylase biotin carboxyl carrier protein
VKFEEIRELIQLLNKSDIAELELELGDFRLALRKGASPGVTTPPIQAPTAGPKTLPATVPPTNLIEIKSPMVGTFYRATSPEASPFVEIGDRVRLGQTVCIIEAMKLMNNIDAETQGRVAEILVENAQPVEFGQVIMRLELDTP